jgi:hypothetical protein
MRLRPSCIKENSHMLTGSEKPFHHRSRIGSLSIDEVVCSKARQGTVCLVSLNLPFRWRTLM